MIRAKIKNKINSDAHLKELLKGSSIAFVLRIVGIVAGYVFTLLVTRTLGAEAWGIFALSLVVLQIASVIGRLGMDTALLRFTAEYTAKGEINTLKEIYKKALTLVVPFSILVAISVYFLSPILADKVFHKPYLTNYFRIVSLIIVPFVLLWIHSESIRGLKEIKEYMVLQQTGISIIAVILFLIGLAFIKSHFLPIFSYALAILILSAISIYLWKKHLRALLLTNSLFNYSTDPSFNKSTNSQSNHLTNQPVNQSTNSPFNHSTNRLINYSTILSVSLPMLLSSSLALIMGWADTIMLGMFRTTEEVGIYNVALKISMITSITLMAINTIAAPKFAEFWGRGDIKGLAKVAQQSTKLIFWTSFPLLLIFLIFPSHILGIFGKEFEAGSIALIILTIGQFINIMTGSVGYILQMSSNEKSIFLIWLISSLVVIVGNYILIPKIGIVGAALSTFFSHLWASLAALILVRIKLKFWNLPFNWRNSK